MAALAIGEAALNALINVLFDRMASKRFVDFITRRKLDVGLFEKLKIYVNSVRGVLDDAEEKEITKPTVKKWLDELKNAFFEADDLLDKIVYEATRSQCEAESRSAYDDFFEFMCPPESFTERLTQILETIEHLVREKDEHGLREKDEYYGPRKYIERMPTTSVVVTSNIFGRAQDQEKIMKVLLSDDVNPSNNLSIISIVGLGGIGKTTLAQLIYNNDELQERFRDRGWVCVSEKFDFPRIATDIAKSVAQIDCNNKTLEEIRVELTENSRGKRFLLVLDDAWNVNFTDWEQLLTPLQFGGPGSTIIITTRNDDVAKALRSSSTFHLGKLDSSDCWQLFCKYAFDNRNRLEDHRHLEDIGQKIVEKCDGLPLAVKIMGGVLSYDRDERYWNRVLKNDLWNISEDEILPVLRLSYCYLPSYLKQCFAYCSIFPKAYRFNKKQLILLWMAEGFLIEQGNWTMEEVGEKYFEALVSRSFFQHVDNSFVMHDLINDLARVVAKS